MTASLMLVLITGAMVVGASTLDRDTGHNLPPLTLMSAHVARPNVPLHIAPGRNYFSPTTSPRKVADGSIVFLTMVNNKMESSTSSLGEEVGEKSKRRARPCASLRQTHLLEKGRWILAISDETACLCPASRRMWRPESVQPATEHQHYCVC